ncbi:MAG TPA: hypothetical protein PK765_00370 [bacterium]|nr:hypothetical protein [bacterium]
MANPRKNVQGILLPNDLRLGEVPMILTRLMRGEYFSSHYARSLSQLVPLLQEAMGEIARRIQLRPTRDLKRAFGRYRRMLDRVTPAIAAPSVLPTQSDIGYRQIEMTESHEITIRLLDERIAQACLEAFFETFLVHARRILASGAIRTTRNEYDRLTKSDPVSGISAGTFFRCGRHEFSIHPFRIADLFSRSFAGFSHDGPADHDRLIRSLVLEIAAYPWTDCEENSDIPFMLSEKRA